MSGTAVFRSAARRVLRPTTRSRSTLAANNEQRPFSSPMEIITPRRHYSAAGGGGVNNMEEGLNSTPGKKVLPKEILDLVKRKKEEQAARHVFLTVDEVASVFDRRNLLMQQLVQEKLKYDRLKRVLVRVPIFVCIAIFVKNKYFSGEGEEAKNNMTESD